jgi:hypothetical protein
VQIFIEKLRDGRLPGELPHAVPALDVHGNVHALERDALHLQDVLDVLLLFLGLPGPDEACERAGSHGIILLMYREVPGHGGHVDFDRHLRDLSRISFNPNSQHSFFGDCASSARSSPA